MQKVAFSSISWATTKGRVTLDFSIGNEIAITIAGRKGLLISELPGISSSQLQQMAGKFRQIPSSLRNVFFPRVVQTVNTVYVHLHVRGLGGGGGPSKGATAAEVYFFDNLPSSESVAVESQDVVSVRSLVSQILLHPENGELLRLAFKIVEAFAQKKVVTLSMINEIAPLASVPNKNLLRFLLEAFVRHIRDSALTHIQTFHPLKQIIQTADPAYLEQDDLICIMGVVFQRIAELHSQPQTAIKRYKALRALSGILDAMADTGIIACTDKNLFVIDQDNFRNPVFDVLRKLQDDGYLPLEAEAAYAAQALARIPKNESRPFSVLRRLVQAGEAIGLVIEACRKISPSFLKQAYAPFKEAFRLFPEVQRWHDELRTLHLFIQRNCLREFEVFVWKLYQKDVAPAFEIGVLNLLCEVVEGHSSELIRSQALCFLYYRCTCLQKQSLQKAFVQRLLEFARHSEELVRTLARQHLDNLRKTIKPIAHLIPQQWDSYPIDPSEEASLDAAELFHEVQAGQKFIRVHDDDYEIDRKENDEYQQTHLPAPMHRFVGRRQHLERLEKYAEDCRADGPRTLILVQGPCGIGKSELVIQFANASRRLFSFVWHFNAEHLSALHEGYRNLAKDLKIDKKDDLPQAVIEKVHHRLENSRGKKPWLLIFDNLEVSVPVPSRGGMVIGTSQLSIWDDDAQLLLVEPVNEEEALEFFSPNMYEDLGACKTIISLLDGYPLLLRKAVYDIQSLHLTASKYLERLKDNHPIWQAPPGGRYPKALAAAFEVALSHIQKTAPLAYRFLEMCAYLNPDMIHFRLIESWLVHEKQEAHFKEEIIRTFEESSIMLVKGQTLSFHRLLQMVIRAKIRDKAPEIFKVVYTLLRQMMPSLEVNIYSSLGNAWLIGSHVLECAKVYKSVFSDLAEELKKGDSDCEYLPLMLCKAGYYSETVEVMEDFMTALDLMDSICYNMFEMICGYQFLSVRVLLFALLRTGQVDKCLYYYEKTMPPWEVYRERRRDHQVEHIARHARDALVMNETTKAEKHMVRKQYHEALLCLKKAEPYHQDSLVFTRHGDCYMEMERYEEAFSQYQKALKSFTESFPPATEWEVFKPADDEDFKVQDPPEWQIEQGARILNVLRPSLFKVFPFIDGGRTQETEQELKRQCIRFFGEYRGIDRGRTQEAGLELEIQRIRIFQKQSGMVVQEVIEDSDVD